MNLIVIKPEKDLIKSDINDQDKEKTNDQKLESEKENNDDLNNDDFPWNKTPDSNINKNDSNSKNKKIKNYVFFKTYSSENNPFNFKSVTILDGIIFFLGAIIFPFIVNIIITYTKHYDSGTNEYNSQRLFLELVSTIFSVIVLIYLWVIYKKKFVSMGGLAFFWMVIFMPLLTLLWQFIMLSLPFYKNSNENTQMIIDTLGQMISEIIAVTFILLTTKGLIKRILQTYKDGWWIFLLLVFFGVAACFVLNIIFNLIPIDSDSISTSTSDNQDQLNKLLNTVAGTIVLGIFTLLVAPFMEELSTRNGIYTLSGNKWLGLVAATIFFAGMHVSDYGDWKDILDYLGASFALSFLFLVANGNVAYTITTHSIINIIAYVVTLYQHAH